jgi:lipopolysaccharide export system permease protein
MKTLQLYCLKEVLAPIFVSALFFVFALMVLRLFALSQLLLSAGVSWSIVGEVFLIIIGTVLTFVIPMAVLLGTLIGVGRLAAENEILAMRAAGVHLGRVFYPSVIVAFFVSGGLIAMGHYAMPAFFQRLTNLSIEAQFNLLSNLQPGVMYPSIGNTGSELSLYYDRRPAEVEREPGILKMEGVTMRLILKEVTEPGAVAAGPSATPSEEFIISARAGRIEAHHDSRKIELYLENGSLTPLPHERSTRTTVMRFDSLVNEIDTDLDINQRIKDTVREMKFPQLFQLVSTPPEKPIWNNDEFGRRIFSNWRAYFAARNEFIQRFSLPLACVAFVMVAIPLAIEIRPKAKAFSFLMAAGLMMLYYMFLTLASSLGASGTLDASILSWTLLVFVFMLPNMLLAGAGAFLFWRALKR